MIAARVRGAGGVTGAGNVGAGGGVTGAAVAAVTGAGVAGVKAAAGGALVAPATVAIADDDGTVDGPAPDGVGAAVVVAARDAGLHVG